MLTIQRLLILTAFIYLFILIKGNSYICLKIKKKTPLYSCSTAVFVIFLMHRWRGWESAYIRFGNKNGTSTLESILTPAVLHHCYFCEGTQGLGSKQLTLCWDTLLVIYGSGCITGKVKVTLPCYELVEDFLRLCPASEKSRCKIGLWKKQSQNKLESWKREGIEQWNGCTCWDCTLKFWPGALLIPESVSVFALSVVY